MLEREREEEGRGDAINLNEMERFSSLRSSESQAYSAD